VQQLAAEGQVYLANSMNPLRLEGQKTVGIEIVQQFDWQIPDWIHSAQRNMGNASAMYAGFQNDARTGHHFALTRGWWSLKLRTPTRCTAAWTAGKREVTPMQAKPTQATAIQIGNP